jgi:hypothetical protein
LILKISYTAPHSFVKSSAGLLFILTVILVVATLVFALLAMNVLFGDIQDEYFRGWNAARLIPAFNLARGLPVYSGPENGPVNGMIYGPMMAIAYLPAAFARSPISAILLGQLLSVIFFFLPVFYLCLYPREKGLRYFLFAAYPFFCFCVFSFIFPPLRYVAFRIHADAPALGFSALACAFLWQRKYKDNILSLPLSALFAVLAVWTKQSAFPILLALPAYLFIKDGFRCLKRYVLCLGFSGAAVSSVFLFTFGPRNLFFNMFIVPARCPWKKGDLFDLLMLALYCLLPAAIAAFYFLRRKFVSHHHWSMLAIVGIFMVPVAVLGYLKIGGDVNALSFCFYFFAAAAVLALRQHIQAKVSGYLAVGIVALFVLFNFTRMPGIFKKIPFWLQAGSRQTAYEYAKRHPGEVWFPWDPLTSLMAEGKSYHFIYGLYDRSLSGFPLSQEHFLRHMPSNIRIVADPWDDLSYRYVSLLLPEFSQRVEMKEFPGWFIYTRGQLPNK